MSLTQEEHYLIRKEEVAGIVAHISDEKKEMEVRVANPQETFAKLRGEEREKFYFFYNQWMQNVHNLKFSEKSPFFVRLVVKFDDKNEQETIYIGKFSFLMDKVYSWTVPVAGLRFIPPGPFSYVRPNGQSRSGVVLSREDYFISNSHIVSLYDVTATGRSLVYDEHIAIRKTGFGLSDIVRELERAQNEIIVLDPKGQMVISGPAGSGKTTLALHRVAYLLQNPDTSEIYKPENTIIFIQDESSITYFSSLFVNLGVEGVKFTTFETWCSGLLALSKEYSYVDRYGDEALLRDWYEWNKVKAIETIQDSMRTAADPWKTLDVVFGAHEDSAFKKLWKTQKEEKVLDKQDLTALLKIQVQTDDNKVLQQKRVFKKKGKVMAPVHIREELHYDTLLVDEFENYTADQLLLLNKTLSPKASCLFVGDIHQQTKFGSISDFSQSGIAILENRNILLSKVYRNSRSVLQMLATLGYKSAEDNQNTVEGKSEWVHGNHQQQIKDYLLAHQDDQIGIICYNENTLERTKEFFNQFSSQVHIGTVTEFQGLEFDSVFIIHVDKDIFAPSGLHPEFDQERLTILRERLYVAITRARENVVVYSDSSREEIKGLLR